MSNTPKSDAIRAVAAASGVRVVNVVGDPMSRTAGADFRPILEDDIASAARGLQMFTKSEDELHALIKAHTKINLFASAVIVVAAARQLIRRSAFRFELLTVDELHAIRRDPSQLTRSEIDAHLFQRDRATA